MSIEGDGNPDEYVVTALQIFEYCGADSSSTLRVDSLMDKFAPFVKTKKAEYSYLKSLLDPERTNPEITVTKLAETLNEYSENQKIKVDLEESFNLKSGPAPHDSDSGISTDGFQLLEELHCELKEKSHLAQQLRSQLDFSDRQHEEALASLTAERDSLRSHLNMLREENMTLTHVRRDYEDVCERLCLSEKALDETRRELECNKKRLRVLTEQVCTLETEKLTLTDLLEKSKAECHHINEMYASRQSALLEQNERLRSEHANLSVRLQDHEEFMHTVVKEKVTIEMELKELLNKTNQTHHKMDRSIDVSYTDDQMLSALDSLNVDSRFHNDHSILDESLSTFKEDNGRLTNISLFDEIRLSFCNMSKHNITGVSFADKTLDIATQTNDNIVGDSSIDKEFANSEVQTNLDDSISHVDKRDKFNVYEPKKERADAEIQTDIQNELINSVKSVEIQTVNHANPTKEFKNVEVQTQRHINIEMTEMYEVSVENREIQTNFGQDNLNIELKNDDIQLDKKIKTMQLIDNNNDRGTELQIKDPVNNEKPKTNEEVGVNQIFKKKLQDVAIQNDLIRHEIKDLKHFQMQTETEGITTSTQTIMPVKLLVRKRFSKFRNIRRKKADTETQTDIIEANNNNDCNKCLEFEKIDTELEHSHNTLVTVKNVIDKYEENLHILKNLVDEGNEKNTFLETVVDDLKTKLAYLNDACAIQDAEIKKLLSSSIVHDKSEQVSTPSQTDLPCSECVKRNGSHGLRRYLWEPLKCLFQLFAVVCFMFAITALYGVTRRWQSPCIPQTPWSWLQLNDLMDFFIRIEYISDVPM